MCWCFSVSVEQILLKKKKKSIFWWLLQCEVWSQVVIFYTTSCKGLEHLSMIFSSASSHWHLLGNSKFSAAGSCVCHCLKIVSYREIWLFSFCFPGGDSRHSGSQKQEWKQEMIAEDLISAVWLGSAWRISQCKMGSWNRKSFLIWSLNAWGLVSARCWALWKKISGWWGICLKTTCFNVLLL